MADDTREASDGLPEGYKPTSEEDQKKAKRFFDYAKTVADSGQLEYSIELYVQGLTWDPEAVDMHQAMREVSLRRKATGGKPMGMKDQWGLPKAKDEKTAMLNAEKKLAYDPGNTALMVEVLQNAVRGGYYDTVMWIGPIMFRAVKEGKPEFSKFIILKDTYKSIKRFAHAVEACQEAMKLRPNDMDLSTEEKHLGALRTMYEGNYDSGKSFRDSIKDMAGQQKLMEKDKDVRTLDSLRRGILEAEQEWKADINEPGKLSKYVDALLKTEEPKDEETAIKVLDEAHQKTKQFRFRLRIGQIRLGQIARQERMLREEIKRSPDDPELRQEYQQFARRRAEQELAEYQLWAENYPTDTSHRYHVGLRLFALGRFDEAIPILQHVRNDPKYRLESAVYLGRAFLEAGFVDEAIDTLKGLIEGYPVKDEKAMNMYYWLGRALELKGDRAAALKAYSQVAQMDFNFRDVQARIKNLRVQQ